MIKNRGANLGRRESREKILDKSLLRCPSCIGYLSWDGEVPRCGNVNCCLRDLPFLTISGKPVLVDFDNSILEKDSLEGTLGASPVRRAGALSLLLRSVEAHPNKEAERFAGEIRKRLPKGSNLLVVGGGVIGRGARSLYTCEDISLIGIDIYLSENVDVVADGHNLPFANDVFDAVWIQAVLEHVLEPAKVVSEIHRVLKVGGLVFADTPFMQQVHEGAYDFTRFTASGHRWLFRRFECIESGVTAGAGTALLWSIQYFIRAITGSRKLGRVSTWPFLWLRFFDGKSRNHEDGASGVHFFGAKSEGELTPHQIVEFYDRVA